MLQMNSPYGGILVINSFLPFYIFLLEFSYDNAIVVRCISTLVSCSKRDLEKKRSSKYPFLVNFILSSLTCSKFKFKSDLNDQQIKAIRSSWGKVLPNKEQHGKLLFYK